MAFEFKNYAIVDACGARVKIARIACGEIAASVETSEPAMESFCEAFYAACPNPLELEAVMVCTGPGSVLGIRASSVAMSCIAAISGAKIFEWNSMEVAAFAMFKGGVCRFTLLAPGRKGFANALEFANGNFLDLKEISTEETFNLDPASTFLLDQRENVESPLERFERIALSANEIAETLSAHPELASKCETPPDAKSPAKKEFVKWKDQARI